MASLERGVQDPMVIVSSYTEFQNLAHGPTGTEARAAFWTFRLNTSTGKLCRVSVNEEPVCNPAFSRPHPTRDVMYACSESVVQNGEIIAYDVDRNTGVLRKSAVTDARGTSTCYITLDKQARNMLIVNYWDATIHVFGVDRAGNVGPHRFCYDPNEGREMVAQAGASRGKGRVNHSENDASAQAERQADPHSHAIVLDPYYGKIAYVPDLGKDTVRQFLFDPETGHLTACGSFPSGKPGHTALGPRYIEFHPTLPVAYVVNELSSEVAVFVFDHGVAEGIMSGRTTVTNSGDQAPVPTLRLVQNISTIPMGWPRHRNTCGRIAVHRHGDFVLVSNRGHNSVASFRVNPHSNPPGLLTAAAITHTHGATPRHFAFDPSGSWLLAANQDTDSLQVFRFHAATGAMEEAGNAYAIPSPNFICVMDFNQRPVEASRL